MPYITHKSPLPGGQYVGNRCRFADGETKEIGNDISKPEADRLVKDFPEKFNIEKTAPEQPAPPKPEADKKEAKPEADKSMKPEKTK